MISTSLKREDKMVRIRWRVSTLAAVAISLLLASPSQTFAGSAGVVRIDSHEFQGQRVGVEIVDSSGSRQSTGPALSLELLAKTDPLAAEIIEIYAEALSVPIVMAMMAVLDGRNFVIGYVAIESMKKLGAYPDTENLSIEKKLALKLIPAWIKILLMPLRDGDE